MISNLNIVFVIVCGMVVTVAVYDKILKWRRAAQLRAERERAEDQETVSEITALRCVMEELSKKVPELSALPEITRLAAGMEAMCKAMAERTDVLNKAVEALQAAINPASLLNEYSLYDEDNPAARRAAEKLEVADLVRRGIAPEEAVVRTRERNIYEGLNR